VFLLHLHACDNVACLPVTVEHAATIRFEEDKWIARPALGLGHKIAVRRIEKSEKIIKFGAPIGSATETIDPGAHVHLHNMKSDYLRAFTLREGDGYGK